MGEWGRDFFFLLAYPSSNSIVMEVHKCLGDFLLVSTVSIQLSRVQEVLRKCDPIRDVVATRTPLPSLYRDETVSRRVATTLAAEVTVGAGWSDLVNSDGWGKCVCKGCLFIHCKEKEREREGGREGRVRAGGERVRARRD